MVLMITLIAGTVILPSAIIIFILLYKDQLKSQGTALRWNSTTQTKKPDTKLYEVLSAFPLIGTYVTTIKGTINNRLYLDEVSARIKSVSVAAISILISLIAYLLMNRLYGTTLYMKAVMVVFAIYINSFTIDRLIGGSNNLLEGLTEFINDIKHHYHALNMVDEAIYEATVKADPVVESHGREIYNRITSSEGVKELEGYYERCPNKFLKILAGFSYMVKEYGDKKVHGVSLYIKNLNYIMEEIYLETVKKSQLAYWLKGLPIITILPVLFPPWIENWMSSNFPASAEFFHSSAAFFLKNVILFLIVICYLLITKLQRSEDKVKRYKGMDTSVEQEALKTFWVKNILRSVKPAVNSLGYKKLLHLLQEAGSPLNVDQVYLRKLLCGFAAFIAFLAIFTTAHRVNTHAIMNDAAYGLKKNNLYLMLGKVSSEEQASKEQINRYDEEIMRLFSKHRVSSNDTHIIEKIKLELDKNHYAYGDTQIAAERIYNKLAAKAGEHLQVWEVLVSILMAWLFSNIPIWVLLFEKALRKADMQDEVFQFHTAILLLMHHESVDVRKVLEWMYQLSDVFREPINRCLNNFHDPKSALNRLKEDTKFKEFVYLIDNLEMANDKISIKAAFDSLELERDFYKENRKEANKRSVNSKIELGKLIGFIPFYGVIILYLVVPLLFVSIMSLQAIMEQLGQG